jgi:hypothetical protein
MDGTERERKNRAEKSNGTRVFVYSTYVRSCAAAGGSHDKVTVV